MAGPVSYTHLKLKERLDRGEDLPQYIKDHPIYYAGPAKTPEGMACGSMAVSYTHLRTGLGCIG